MTGNEVEGIEYTNKLDFSLPCLSERAAVSKRNNIVDIYEKIWRGGMPEVLHADAEQRQEYFNSYIETYLLRDASEAGGIADAVRFRKFLYTCVALTAEQVNYKTLAESAEISQPTAKEWLHILQSLGIVYLLQPYANNELKRLVKTPKLYFCDTGLCAYLSMWLTRDTLMNGAASGHYFETYIVMELVKNFSYAPSGTNLTYYRDSNAKEVDLFAEENGLIHPLEIKKSASPNRREVKKYEFLDKAGIGRGCGGIICMCEDVIPIDEKNSFIPCNIL